MKKILYAGGTIFTTDEVAEAVFDYAAALANTELASHVDLPAFDTQWEPTTVMVVIGPASQLVAENYESSGSLDAADFLQDIRGRIQQLSRQRQGQA